MIYRNNIKKTIYLVHNNTTMSAFNQITDLEQDHEFPVVPHCMRRKPIIDYATLRFHDDSIPHPIKIFKDEDTEYKFGILDIKIRGEIPITTKHIHIFFTIDTSGSMSCICSDGRRKMEHINHTLENMLRMFHKNNECNISVHIQSFDTIPRTIIRDVGNIRESNLDELILLSQKIKPAGSTNIELALQKASEEITNYHTANPEHEVVHIFLTDGDITDGTNSYDDLIELVPKNCTNVFIGYGIDHDSNLLSCISSKKGNEYRFIDALEKAGLVYGEIIHGILYKAIEDVTLTANNGEFYDFQTNKWHNSIQIGNLLSEQKKTFHIRSKNPENCHITIFGKTIIKTREFQTINVYENQTDVTRSDNVDLGVYMFRQKTQELLYQARNSYDEFQELQQQNDNLKQELNDFHKMMLNYMKENMLENCPIMKMLCDDIYIAYKTIGTSLGSMYTCARQTSNGRQQSYMCSATNTQNLFETPSDRRMSLRIPGRIRLQRQTNAPNVNFSDETHVNIFDNYLDRLSTLDETDIDNYTPSQDFLSPFVSDGVVTLMREVSGNYSIGNNITDEDVYEEMS